MTGDTFSYLECPTCRIFGKPASSPINLRILANVRGVDIKDPDEVFFARKESYWQCPYCGLYKNEEQVFRDLGIQS